MPRSIAALVLLFALEVPALGQSLGAAYFKKQAASFAADAARVRRQLHRIPELCYQEQETAAYVARYLRGLGLKVQTNLAGHGVKAVLRGNRAQPVIGIRADMDALPITEETGLSFASRYPGRMHACGHDVHMTNVLMTARLLAGVKDQLSGTVVFLFQPCEEGAPAGKVTGALGMIKAGALSNPSVDAMLGLHVLPELPAGVIGLRKGPIMANVAKLYIEVQGKASHGASPHQGIDAIYVASSAVVQLQAVVSRMTDPREPVVLSIGKIQGGKRFNIIADSVKMEGTVRTFSSKAHDRVEEGIRQILDGLVTAYGIRFRYRFVRVAPFVNNDDQLTERLIPVFRGVLGQNNVRIIEPLTIAEDFAHYSHKVPSTFFLLGVGGRDGLHTPTFRPSEQVLKLAPALFATAALEYLNARR